MLRKQRVSDRLVERLVDCGWLEPSARVRFVRLYPGHWQRSAGAWVWEIEGAGLAIGSCFTAKECVKAKEWLLGCNGDITPR